MKPMHGSSDHSPVVGVEAPCVVVPGLRIFTAKAMYSPPNMSEVICGMLKDVKQRTRRSCFRT